MGYGKDLNFIFSVNTFCHAKFSSKIDYRKLSTLVSVSVWDRFSNFIYLIFLIF